MSPDTFATVSPTILIVDDEKNTRDGLRRSFEDEFEVYVAADIAGASNGRGAGDESASSEAAATGC